MEEIPLCPCTFIIRNYIKNKGPAGKYKYSTQKINFDGMFLIVLQLQMPSIPDQSAFISRMLACTANNGPNCKKSKGHKYSFIRLLTYNLHSKMYLCNIHQHPVESKPPTSISSHLISFSSAYPGSGRGGSSSSRGPQTSLSRATLTNSDGGIPRCSQASVEI